MAQTIPQHPTTQNVNQLLAKLNDSDPDYRYMSLSDLATVLEVSRPDLLSHDYNTAARTIDHIVKALDDPNGEVQNQAIKCLGPLVGRIPANLIAPLIEKLSTLKLENSIDISLPALALRNVVGALPKPIPGAAVTKEILESYTSVSRVLIPRLLGRSVPQNDRITGASIRLPAPREGMIEKEATMSADAVDVLVEVIKCFGPMINSGECEAFLMSIVGVLDNRKASAAIRKRAVIALSILAVYLTDVLLAAFLGRAVHVLKNPKTDVVTRRLYLTVMGSMVRCIPHRFGQHVGSIVDLVLASLSRDKMMKSVDQIRDGSDTGIEYAETCQAALHTLEAFLASCPSQMRPYTDQSIEACLLHLRYDPNYADDASDEEMEDEEDEDDDFYDNNDEFDPADVFDDNVDASWKVRRSAAKVLHTLISTRSSGDLLESGLLYAEVAPPLIKRFDEREESVRLEVISALSILVRKTGEGVIPEFSGESSQGEFPSQPPQSRKRRRQSSGVSASTRFDSAGLTSPALKKIPSSGPRADLSKLTPQIVKASAKLLKGKSVPTKHATTNLLDDLVLVLQGGLSDQLDLIFDLVLDAIKPTATTSVSTTLGAGGTATATVQTLRIAALRLLRNIAKTHSSSILQSYLSKMVTAVTAVVCDRIYKISSQAVLTVEEIVKTITPPRARTTAQKYKLELSELYDVLMDRTLAHDADAEVRQNAIRALGTLLSRTGGPAGAGLLDSAKRSKALAALLDRLKNETTRLAAVKAIHEIAASPAESFDAEWVRGTSVELSAQLRKANRVLRGSSVQALKHLVSSPAAQAGLDDATVTLLVEALLPVIVNNDTHLLGPSLVILARLVQVRPQLVVTDELTSAICKLLYSSVVPSVLNPLLDLAAQIGRAEAGEKLMNGLLKDVGVNGDPATIGKVIGTLLVASGRTAGVDLDSFIKEARTAVDKARISLALSVLGQAGLRLGSQSPLKPEIFLMHISDSFDKLSLTAAVSMGRAGAGNVTLYLPVILAALPKAGKKQYPLLQSVKELLLQDVDIAQYAATIWDQLIAAAHVEDNKAVCTECIGRLAMIDPETYIPKLDNLLRDKSEVVRGIAVQALRYTFADSGDKFDAVLQNYLVGMLTTMLKDKDREIRRLGMTTFNSAAHNKPDLVLGHLAQLMPYVLHESVIKLELIREVQMGPFKHLVDDGLDVRKGAYETLYSLLETAFSRINTIELYNRIIAGLRDDNDIRALSNLMLSKLVALDPEEATRRLDQIAEAFRATLSTRLKENAVKQEHEKQYEATRSVLRTTILLEDRLKGSAAAASSPTGAHQVWASYFEWVSKDFQAPLRELREENDKTGNTNA